MIYIIIYRYNIQYLSIEIAHVTMTLEGTFRRSCSPPCKRNTIWKNEGVNERYSFIHAILSDQTQPFSPVFDVRVRFSFRSCQQINTRVPVLGGHTWNVLRCFSARHGCKGWLFKLVFVCFCFTPYVKISADQQFSNNHTTVQVTQIGWSGKTAWMFLWGCERRSQAPLLLHSFILRI